MDENYKNKKINIAIIGSGQWGKKVSNAISLISRYNTVGVINSSTTDEEKARILNDADVLYIAVHSENQMEYVEYGLDNDKHIICESPFLNSIEERKYIYEKINILKNNKFFYINYPYIQDHDSLAMFKVIAKTKPNFISIKCSGPIIRDSIVQSKKTYSNQAINIIHFLYQLRGKESLENFNIIDDKKGYIAGLKGETYEFSWGISDEPKLEIKCKTESESQEKTIYYDQYDQVIPLLLMLTNKIHNLFPIPMMENKMEFVNDMWYKIVISSYLSASSSEYFSDIFVNISESELPFSITNPLNLFFNGGFNNVK